MVGYLEDVRQSGTPTRLGESIFIILARADEDAPWSAEGYTAPPQTGHCATPTSSDAY
jgi:hypothetical protein